MKVTKFDEYIINKNNFEQTKAEFDEYERKFMQMITDYVKDNAEFRVKYSLNKFYKVLAIFKEENGWYIGYENNDSSNHYCKLITDKEYSDIMYFIENYDTYKASKTYNL